MMSPRLSLSFVLAVSTLAQPGASQHAISVPMAGQPAVSKAVPNQFIVRFKQRSFDLKRLRAAILNHASVEAVDAIVADLDRKADAERAGFAGEVKALGGAVLANLWVIDASLIRLPADKIAAVEKLDDVAWTEADTIVYPVLRDSTNANNHNSDAANLMNGTGGKKVTGTGITVAILDTGIDASMGSSGRPHVSFYRNGNVNDKTGGGIGGSRILARLVAPFATGNGEDDHSHGTMVSSCSASAWGSNSGFAPDAHIVSWKVSSSSNGGATISALAAAWQQVLANRTKYNIHAANNSYSGSPFVTSSAQAALDSCAFNGDVLCCVPSGNSGGNVGSTQAGYNGISCGSINKNTSSISSFSGRGTQSTGKIIPDIVAVGASVIMTAFDRETTLFRASGTSFASPSVCGAGILVRHANAKLSALESKALLLNHTRPNTTGSGRGAGVLQADLAVKAAIAGDVITAKMAKSNPTANFTFNLPANTFHSVTVTWFRKVFNSAATDDLNLQVFAPNNQLVGQSQMGGANSYDRVAFTSTVAGSYRAVVSGRLVNSDVDYAIAGAGKPIPPKKPTLTAISPNKVPTIGGGEVTLTGKDLASVTKVFLGTQVVSPKSTSATQVKFDPPMPSVIGPVAVKVENGAGQSNSLTMTYIGVHPPLQTGAPVLFSNGANIDQLFTDKSWIGLYWLSGSATPSKITGVINLGIGANFTSLILFHVYAADKAGFATMSWTTPPGFAGTTIHMQTACFDPANFVLPLDVSNVLSRRVLF